jgi:16S rRNA (cytidine1402-2'-O)-methyltransferase
MPMPGNLYIVATPIGNLKDLTQRAKETLESVGFVICEDTRVTSKIMATLGIRKTLKAWHQRASDAALQSIIREIEQGTDAAYTSDAGTPGVNDPGGKLVALALDQGIRVIPIPGPSALTAAISVCGFPMEHFAYLGFVPHKKGRQTYFKDIAAREEAVVFFESTHRLIKTLESLTTSLDQKRLMFVGRELTKMHETLYRGTAQEVLDAIKATSDKGEAVLIIAPKDFKP